MSLEELSLSEEEQDIILRVTFASCINGLSPTEAAKIINSKKPLLKMVLDGLYVREGQAKIH